MIFQFKLTPKIFIKNLLNDKEAIDIYGRE